MAVVAWAASLASQAGRNLVAVRLDEAVRRARTPADVRERIDLAVACGATAMTSFARARAPVRRRAADSWDEAVEHAEVYGRRLTWALRHGRDYAPVAMLCAGTDPFAERPVVLALLAALMRALVPVHILPHASLASCSVDRNVLRHGFARYRVVIVPPGAWESVGRSCRERLRLFASRGGVVLDFSDPVRSYPPPGAPSWVIYDGPADVARLTSVVTTHVERAVQSRLRIVARHPWLLARRRILGDSSIVWVLNTSAMPLPDEIELGPDYARVERLDPDRGRVDELPALFGGVRPQLEPGRGLLLRLSPGPSTHVRSSWFGHGAGNRAWAHLGGMWDVTTTSPNVAALAFAGHDGAGPAQAAEIRVTYRFRVERGTSLGGVRLAVLGGPRPKIARVGPRAYREWAPCIVAGCEGWACAVDVLHSGKHEGSASIDTASDLPRRWAVVLVGDFAARYEHGDVALGSRVAAAPLVDWSAAGLVDFSGMVEWRRDVDLGSARPLVADISEQAPWFRSVCDLWVDGAPAGRRWWPPYETDITTLVRADVAHVRYRTLAPVPNWRRFLAGGASRATK